MAVESASGQLMQTGNKAVASVSIQVREEFEKTEWEESATVRVQKRLALGLYPCAAEIHLMPEGALDAAMSVTQFGTRRYFVVQFVGMLDPGILLGQLCSTFNALFLEPFEPWSCLRSHGYSDWAYAPYFSQSPKIRALHIFNDAELRQMGVSEFWNLDKALSAREVFSHYALVGCHKYLAVFVEPKTGPRRTAGTETKRRTGAVEGPWEVEFRIPGLGHERRARVGKGETSATFDLPQVEGGGRYEATATFRESGFGGDGATRQALEKVSGQTVRTLLNLSAKPSPPAAQAPAREVVKEIHHYHETRVVEERKPEGAPWDIETVEPFRGGRAVYLVKIRDASKKAFEVEREVRPDIERNLREAFLASMPGMDEGRVRAYAVAEYEGRAIRFRGAAFSVQPLTDGWAYDEETRRGTVRLRFSEGMSPEEAKRWARENIETIVKDKNAALAAGRQPPAGAIYRSLSETLEDGVLTVEFEAVE